MAARTTFPIRYDAFSRALLGLLGGGPRWSGIDVGPDVFVVRLGWMFRARIRRSAVVSAEPITMRTLSRGAHGWAHRWLVNGSTEGLVELRLEPRVRAWVVGFPLSVGVLLVSAEDPEGLVGARSG